MPQSNAIPSLSTSLAFFRFCRRSRAVFTTTRASVLLKTFDTIVQHACSSYHIQHHAHFFWFDILSDRHPSSHPLRVFTSIDTLALTGRTMRSTPIE